MLVWYGGHSFKLATNMFVGSGLKLQRNSVTETGAATAMGILIHAPASQGQSTSSTVP